MSCEHPILAYDYGIDAITGKHKVKMVPRRLQVGHLKDIEEYYGRDSENLLLLPCGKCPSCRMAKMKEWSVRCELEARLYDRNCFVTLTYDEEHCPKYLRKDDLKQFIKALRNKGFDIRYFACGEYGTKTGRPHYHIVLFNFLPDDVKPYAKSHSGGMMMSSRLIDECWKHRGITTIQDFDTGFAAYVAGYVAKKEIQELPDDFKGHEPFLLMSRRPGLGYGYLKDNAHGLYRTQNVVLKNGKVGFLPRYFKKIMGDDFDFSLISEDSIKSIRLKDNAQMFENSIEYREEFWQNKGNLMKDKLYRRKRGL